MMTLGMLVPVFVEHADNLATEVVRLVDEYAAENAADVLTEYCNGNKNVSGAPGPQNVTGLLYYISEEISEMTCQRFVDLIGKHCRDKVDGVARALM